VRSIYSPVAQKNSPVLIGPAGVGKTTIVRGLAQRFADGAVPPALADSSILAIHATELIAPLIAPRGPAGRPFQLASPGQAILCVEGLFDLAGTGSGWGVTEAAGFSHRTCRTACCSASRRERRRGSF
jgi:hypothetical protein